MDKSQIHILIVDDDPSLRSVLSDFLKRQGFKVETAKNPEEAINAAKIKPFHLAMIDCMLPMKSGIDLIQDLRSSPFSTNPILLMSGIFKESSFIQEIKEKTDIVEYLVKPFDLSSVHDIIHQTLEPLFDKPKIILNSLLSVKNSPFRALRKTIESIEEIRGYDIGFVISMLLDPKIKGHLNLVTPDGEVSGISFAEGKIVLVDTPASESQLNLLLTQFGLLYNSDVEEINLQKKRGDKLKFLVDHNYISPHMVPLIKTQQILTELKNLMSSQIYQFNFSFDAEIQKNLDISIDIQSITPTIHEVLAQQTNHEWLVQFFKNWYDHPLEKGDFFQEKQGVFELPLVGKIKKIKEYIEEKLTIKEILKLNEVKEWELLNALYLLSLRRVIHFSDEKKIENHFEYKKRIENLLKNIETLPVHEIFCYLGSSQSLRPFEIAKIYKEFSMIYHPDKLSAQMSDSDLVLANQKLFALVTEAYSILTHEKKRKVYFDGQKQKAAEAELKSDDLLEKAKKCLSLREFDKARDIIKLAESLIDSDQIRVVGWLLELKRAEIQGTIRSLAPQYLSQLSELQKDLIKNEYYYWLLGLLHKHMDHFESAQSAFNKALALSPHFLDVKRELSLLKDKKTSLSDLVKGDIGDAFKHFFKLKK